MSDQKPEPGSSGEPRPKSVSGRTDPRLKKFLKQARAIIASDGGLNEQSRITLQSLASHMQLPDSLYDQAIAWLQQADGAPIALERYEKAFAEYLDRKFKELGRGVLSLRLEEKFLDRARRKYQVSDVRAQQIIDHRAAVLGISRVSHREAAEYIEDVIIEKISRQTTIEDDIRNNLYKAADSWGIGSDQVDRIILDQLAKNRAAGSFPFWVKTIVVGGLLVTAGLLIGFNAGWIQLPATGPADPGPDSGGSVVVDTDNSITPSPLDPTDPESEGWPEWWDEKSRKSVTGQAATFDWVRLVTTQMAAEQPVNRREGYERFLDSLIRNDFEDRDALNDLFCRLYFSEPDQFVVAGIAANLEKAVQPSSTSLPATIDQIRSAFHTNRLLATLLFFSESEMENRDQIVLRKSLLSSTVRLAEGIDPAEINFDSYLEQSNRLLAIDQWNHLVQTSWTAPVRSASVVQPLYDLTEPFVDRTILDQFRSRSIESTLNADVTRYRDLKEAISGAIASADELKKTEWIRYYGTVVDTGFKRFLGREIALSCGLEIPANGDCAPVLTAFREQYLEQVLAPVFARNGRVNEKTEQIFSTGHQRTTADQIAATAQVVNLNLAMVQMLESPATDFSFIDELLSSGQPDLGSIETDSNDPPANPASPEATDSDRRKKERLLSVLTGQDSTSAAREDAFENLAEIIPRFRDLQYADAERLARYLLGNFESQEEWLNVEQFLQAFSMLPGLKIALADRIVDSSTGVDQSLTVSTLLVSSDRFSASRGGNWRAELSTFFLHAAIEELEMRVKVTPDMEDRKWSGLRQFLMQTYLQRMSIASGPGWERGREQFSSPAEVAASVLPALLEQDFIPNTDSKTRSGKRSALARAVRMTDRMATHEIEATTLLIQVAITMLAESTTSRYPDTKWEVKQAISGFEVACKASLDSAQRLFLAELTLLKILDVRREAALELRRESQ